MREGLKICINKNTKKRTIVTNIVMTSLFGLLVVMVVRKKRKGPQENLL